MADFCADRADLRDILDRTSRGETVLNRHMDMNGAAGVVKVIADVNANIADGALKSTRWFVRPETPKELPSARAVQLSEDVADKIARMSEAEKAEWFDILNDFFDNAPVGVHFVGLNGVMMRANRAEVALLGYQDEPGSYIGCHVRHIHHETAVVEMLLQRLVEGFPVISQPAYLKRRDKQLEAVLIYSGLRLKGGKFQNTRCFLFSDPSPSKPPSETHAHGFAWPRNELEVAP
jgi:PAS domain-containing protein